MEITLNENNIKDLFDIFEDNEIIREEVIKLFQDIYNNKRESKN